MGMDIVEREDAFALRTPPLPEAQQPAERAIGRTRRGIGEKADVARVDPRPHHEGKLGILGGSMRAHDAGQRVAVRHRQG
jgi:hypothetical protein